MLLIRVQAHSGLLHSAYYCRIRADSGINVSPSEKGERHVDILMRDVFNSYFTIHMAIPVGFKDQKTGEMQLGE